MLFPFSAAPDPKATIISKFIYHITSYDLLKNIPCWLFIFYEITGNFSNVKTCVNGKKY